MSTKPSPFPYHCNEIIDRESAAGVGVFLRAVGQIPLVAVEIRDLYFVRAMDANANGMTTRMGR